jgi:carbohydrate kinase (thermoresistant glucokinase family)
MAAAPLVIVMGVSGSGKTTVGKLLARRLKAEFLEGDELHPERNVERMASGIPLTDNDRRDWLRQIAQQLADAHASQHALVVSCSALKRSYRDTLRAASQQLVFVHLHGDKALLEARLRGRTGHYMPASLLDSQLEILEAPGPDERAASFDAAPPPEMIAEQAAAWLSAPAVKARR